MAEDKKSFLLYADYIHTVRKMPVDKAGELFITILSYVNDENPQPKDMLVELVFEPIKQQLKRDLKRWEVKKLSKAEAGKLGGLRSGEKRSKKSQDDDSQQINEANEANEANASNLKQNEANASKLKQTEANEAVNANANVTVINSKLSRDEVYRLMRSNTNRKDFSDNLIEEQSEIFFTKYEGKEIKNLAALVNKWISNLKPDIDNKGKRINSFV